MGRDYIQIKMASTLNPNRKQIPVLVMYRKRWDVQITLIKSRIIFKAVKFEEMIRKFEQHGLIVDEDSYTQLKKLSK